MSSNPNTLRFVNDHFAHALMDGLKKSYEEDFEDLVDEDEFNSEIQGFGPDSHIIEKKFNLRPEEVGGFVIRLGLATESSKASILEKLSHSIKKSSNCDITKNSCDEDNIWKRVLLKIGFPLDIVDRLMSGHKGIMRRYSHELLEAHRHDLFYFSQKKENLPKIAEYQEFCLSELGVSKSDLEKYIFELGVNWEQAGALVKSLGLNRLKTETCLRDFGMSIQSAIQILDLLGCSVFEIEEHLVFQNFFNSQREMLA